MSRLLFILSFLATSQIAFAQPSAKSLDSYFQKIHKDWDIPGISVGIIKDGKVVLSKGYGVLEKGKSTKADGASLYAIASNTKAFIATSMAMLVEAGKLNWDDPVKKHLPYFELYDDYATEHTTVRDLLCHRVGLGTFSGDAIWYKSNYSAEEVVKRAAKVPQAYDFRAGYGYTNLMFITAGEVIKAVSGQTWSEFAKANIFKPLGMHRTITSTNDLAKFKNVATPHTFHDSNTNNEPIAWTNWDNMGAAGGIISSTDDMLKWTQLHLNGGKVDDQQIYPTKAQEVLWQPHNNHKVSHASKKLFPSRHFSAYALGWGTFDYGGHQIVNHSGGYDGMYSRVTMVPEADLGIVILTNSMKGVSTWMMYHILDEYLGIKGNDWNTFGLEAQAKGEKNWTDRKQGRIDKRLKNTQPTLLLAGYTGNYRCEMYGDIEVTVKNGALQLNFKSAPALNATLAHWHLNTYKINWQQPHAWFDFGTVQFVLDNNAEVERLNFDVPNDDIFFYEINAKKIKE